jgi:hypothetical protein
MIGLLCFVLTVLALPFKSKLRLEAENAVLRHQLNVLRRRLHGRVRLTNNDRWFFIQLYHWFPSILQVLTIIRPETLVRWHRAGFRCYWRWKSRPQGGRPQIDTELRVLIRRISVENPLWGAPYFTANCSSWGLRSPNQASPSTWSNDGGHPARNGGPSCVTTRRTLPPWTCSLFQLSVSTCSMPSSLSGSTAETSHLRRILKSYADYCNGIRTHRSLNTDAPASRFVQRAGVIRSRAILSGLHNHYARA